MKRGFANLTSSPVVSGPATVALRGQSGITLLFTLGFLSIMLVMMLSLAMLSRSERRSAALSNDAVRTRLIAESAMERALAELRVGCKDEIFPADSFVTPDSDSDWAGQRLLVARDTSGIKGDLKSGLGDALGSRVVGRELTPDESPTWRASWIPVLSTVAADGTTKQAIIGRYSYVLLDQTGRIDPASVVRRDQSEDSDLAVRTGYSLTDVTLGDLGFANPDRFNYADSDYPGKLPEVGRWFSLAHMIKNMNLTQSEVDLANRTLIPFSHDTEVFWRDRNGNGKWDAGEDSPRLNIVAETDPSVLYQLFVGAVQDFSANENGVNAGADDCAWLKELDGSPWFAAWRDRVFAGYVEGVQKDARFPPALTPRVRTYDLVHYSVWGFGREHIPELKRGNHPLLSCDFSNQLDDPRTSIMPHLDFSFFSGRHLAEKDVDPEAKVRELKERTPGLVAMTLGEYGSLVYDGEKMYRGKAVPVDVVDTLGAGDSWIAAFLCGRLKGESIERSMKEGHRAAAETCRRLGAWGGEA